jgi:8-oxo-dGTP pyrophosphatase MutT (NUDIX family)
VEVGHDGIHSDLPIFGRAEPEVDDRERRAAYVVVLDKAQRVVIVGTEGRLFLPGGGSHAGESPEETAHREVREELAHEIRLIHTIGDAVQYFYAASDRCHYRMLATFFVAEFTRRLPASGEYDLRWMPHDLAVGAFFHPCHAWGVEQAVGTIRAFQIL